MGRLRRRLAGVERALGVEAVEFVTEDGEGFAYRGDPLALLVEDWKAGVEGRPAEHPLAPYAGRRLRLKYPGRVSDPLWKVFDEGEADGA